MHLRIALLEEKTNTYWLKNITIIGNNYSGLAISIYLKLKNNEDKISCIQQCLFISLTFHHHMNAHY